MPSLSHTNVLGAGSFCRDQVMIEMLSADILLNIFHHYLYASPKIWPTLTHVCRTWRQIVLRYPLGLDLPSGKTVRDNFDNLSKIIAIIQLSSIV